MCGIVGIVGRNTVVASEILDRATQSLAHRGPDDSGTVIVRDGATEIGLGNRRLAILDLSPLGHQPMEDPRTGNWVAYNGEIYNFREIRRKLEREGAKFRSHSDTEVLLEAYGRWGESCLGELRGMFAFAIWDAKQHRLILARDPMGIKPLYYGTWGPYFLFASEIRTLLGTGLIPRRLDQAGLFNFLTFGSEYDPITMIDGMSTLLPGHYLIWQNGRSEEFRYWDPLNGRENPDLRVDVSAAERKRAEEQLCSTLDESVAMQMVSDVPVGVFLSGGIDSSALVGILSRNGFYLNTFSIVFREADYSEAEQSRLVAEKFGTEHHELLVSQGDALDAIPGSLLAMDQPSIDGFNTYLVSRQTRAAGVKVALSGLGGDELFAGYSSFYTVPRMERFARLWRHLPALARRPLADVFALLTSKNDQNRKLAALVRANGSLLPPYVLSRMLFTPEWRERLFSSGDAGAIERACDSLRDVLQRAQNLDPINRVSYLESRCYMLNTLLRDSDAMSMAHGLEVRVPLIDHRLAEKLFAMPGSWKLDGHTPKLQLVSALHGALPDSIVYCKKRGFTLPFEHWLRDELQPVVEKALLGFASGLLSNVVEPKAVSQVWRDFLAGRTSWSRPWSLYVLQRWCELHSIGA
jgi:asparagine synthase (glutamine-hydrolysing)